jgi:hypothetical protein
VGIELQPEPNEVWRIMAQSVGQSAFGFDASFADATHVVTSQFGNFGPPLVNDVAFALDITTGASTELVRSNNVPFTLGVGPCDPCAASCYVADVDRRVIHRFDFSQPSAIYHDTFACHDPTGLPPRVLGMY